MSVGQIFFIQNNVFLFFFSSSSNTIFLFLLDGSDSFMARIDFATMKSFAERSINSEINGMKLCRLLGFKRV